MGENRGHDGEDQRGYARDDAADEDDDEPDDQTLTFAKVFD